MRGGGAVTVMLLLKSLYTTPDKLQQKHVSSNICFNDIMFQLSVHDVLGQISVFSEQRPNPPEIVCPEQIYLMKIWICLQIRIDSPKKIPQVQEQTRSFF